MVSSIDKRASPKKLTLPDGSRRLIRDVDLSELIEARGKNVAQVSREAGVSRQTLHTWIRGLMGRTRRDKLLPVADALGVSLDELRAVLAETVRRHGER